MSETLPASPYKGLTPFADTAIDATLFFGRELESRSSAPTWSHPR